MDCWNLFLLSGCDCKGAEVREQLKPWEESTAREKKRRRRRERDRRKKEREISRKMG